MKFPVLFCSALNRLVEIGTISTGTDKKDFFLEIWA